MKSHLLILYLFFSSSISFSQNWSQPVNIYSGGNNYEPDFAIDQSGVFHCVWTHKLGVNYRKIYYSKSTDSGMTWSQAQDLSLNSTLWMDNPHIISDTNNVLYVSYDYNTGNTNETLVVLKKFINNKWSNFEIISADMPGSMHSRLVVDNNNKLYCFWYNGILGGKIFYRTFSDGIWDEIRQPYSGNKDMIGLSRVVVDRQNNLHCAGVHHYEGQSGYDDRAIYFSFSNGNWNTFKQLSDDTTWEGIDIALDTLSQPSITWGQYSSDSIPPPHGTYVSSRTDGENWSIPILLADNQTEEQAIGIDYFNQKYIFDNEKTGMTFQQVCHIQTRNGWVSEVVKQDNYGFFNHKILKNGNKMCVIYLKVDTVIGSSAFSTVQFIEHQIALGFGDSQTNISDISIYPNPLTTESIISFRLEMRLDITLSIYSINGILKKTLLSGSNTSGNYSILWDGRDNKGKDVKSGLYLIQFQVGKNRIINPLIVIH